MAVLKKFVKVGSSFSLIIDKTIMELLNLDPNTELSLTTDGKSLIFTPVQKNAEIEKEQRQNRINEAVKKSLERFDGLYQRLAK
jgi:antitoxin component of MazEF toxin-antitoxin module